MHENKKICKCCGRNRKLGKFGKLSSSPDGKNRYCRDCMKEFRRRYNETPKGQLLTKICIQKWKDTNKEHIKEYNKQYYLNNRERILYNKKCRETTECMFMTQKPKNNKSRKPKNNKLEKSKFSDNKKINKGREVCIVINPKRKKVK